MRKTILFLSVLTIVIAICLSSKGVTYANAGVPSVPVSGTDQFMGEMNTNRAPFDPAAPGAGVTYSGNQVTITAPANPSPFVWEVGQLVVPSKAKIVLETEVKNGVYSPGLQKFGGGGMPAPDLTIKNGDRVTYVWYVNERENFLLSALGMHGSRTGSDPCVITIHSLKVYKTSEKVVGEMDTSKYPVDPATPRDHTTYSNSSITISDPASDSGFLFWDAGQIQVHAQPGTRVELDATLTNGLLADIALFKSGFVALPDPALVVQGDSVKATWVANDTADFTISTLRSKFVRSGPAPAALKINSLRVWQPLVSAPLPTNALDADEILQTPPVHDTKLRMHNGAMTLFLDNNPISGQSWTSILPFNVRDQYLDEVVNGLDYPIVGLPFAVGQNTLNNMYPTTWLADNVYDWTSLDTQAQRILGARSDVKIILFLALDGATWWTDENPDAANPDVDQETALVNNKIPGSKGIPDYLSPKWKAASREVLRQLIAHVQTSEWGKSVIGYELFNGFSMDTNFFIPHNNDRVIADFRTYLTDKYETDAALRLAWKDPSVSLNTALPVSALPAAHAVPPGLILQPSENQRFLDTRALMLGQFREVFSDFAKVIKEATSGRALVGARTGDFVGQFGWDETTFTIGEDSGWLMPLLQDPNFDYFDVQEPYVGRHLGDGANVPVIPVKAVNQYGKAVFIENDVRTYLSAETEGFGRTPDLPTTIQKQRQIFANALTNGTNPTLFQLSFGYDNTELLAEYKRQEDILREALQKDRNSTAEVAFVFDPDMRLYLGKDAEYSAPSRYFALFDMAKHMWQRAGVPFDMIFLDQIEDMDPYKVYVFFNTWKYSTEQLDMIRSKVFKNGQTAIFLWADGVLSGTESYNDQTISDLTGMDIRLSNEERSWAMKATAELASLTTAQEGQEVGLVPPDNMHPGLTDARTYKYGPSYTITIDDNDNVIPLAQNEHGQITAGLFESSDYQVIYSASGNLTLPLFELALQKANAFQYTDSTALFMMNKSYVGVHADKTETIRLQFPTPEILTDLFSGQVYPASTVHEIPVERSHTYLFARESVPPASPANVTATAGNGKVTLNWESVTGATYYSIYYGTTTGTYGAAPVATVTGTTYDVTDLTNGTTYFFAIKAGHAGAVSAYSNEVSTAPQAGSYNSGSTTTTSSSTSDNKVIATDGKLTLPIGKTGEVSLGDAIIIAIPAGATNKELKVTIEKVLDTQKLLTGKEVLVSPVFEILKNFPENFLKPVTLKFLFDPASLKNNQTAAVFYYDEVKKEWVKVDGGKISGNHITVQVDHFTKYAVLAVDGAVDPTTEVNFSDISGHWAEANIKQALSKGIVSGYPDGTFKPDTTVTRAEFSVMLMNALKLEGEGVELTFKDTAKIGSWALKAVAQAVQADIITGYEDGSFRPDAEITRPEMAVLLANALHLTGEANAATGFADDKDIPEWAKGAVAAIKKIGVVEGRGTNEFAPNAQTTRGEAVTVLLRMLAQMNK
ncbi:S-layer homology domain-containing protein [Paenibacillus eucommiae]|uniref:S-layer homology domain-containing protein n=1 Tax=Paenibacillus eucommiae TaxID=1355755 RepID=A0ABS4ILL4_9BACL|nr:S-layer homology domain-containing protein [Paenibacillus eucommiae]MBP1988458.1 hypothetical protein [Paenibacillus eucommiae]